MRLAAVFAVSVLLPSCTVVGGFIGSSMPDYTPASVGDARDGYVDYGEKIAVVRASDGREVVGQYQGLDSSGIEVATDDGRVTVDPSDVRSVSVARGNHWLEAVALGFAADVAIALLIGTRLAQGYPDTSSVGNIHVGSDGVTVGAR